MSGPLVQPLQLTPTNPSLPLLVVGPSLGTTVETLWSACASELANAYDVVGWDLPGHGRSPAATVPFSVADLAAAVLALADEVLGRRGTPVRASRTPGTPWAGRSGSSSCSTPRAASRRRR